jgi:hypothetical protein
MHADWFFPKKLAQRLARNEVANREVAYLMLGNLLFSQVIYYGAFTWGNAVWSMLNLLEAVAVVTVIITGFASCYFAAGGDTCEHFAKYVNCLSFGIWFWTTAIVWVGYWGVLWLFDIGFFEPTQFDRYGIAEKLTSAGWVVVSLWTAFAAFLWQVIYFVWLRWRLIDATRQP